MPQYMGWVWVARWGNNSLWKEQQLLTKVFPFPFLCSEMYVSDFTPVNEEELKLWMTSDGHLTGDMSMTLPPIEQVLLNPYTG